MTTVASDPSAADPRSSLPPGGSPAADAAWLDWCRATCDAANRKWLDCFGGWGRDLPKGLRELVNPWQVTSHVFKWLLGWEFPSGTGPNIRHRIRFVSVQFMLRRAEIEAEVGRYLAEVEDERLQAIP